MTTPAGTSSLARAQQSLSDENYVYPLWPPLVAGCPQSSNEQYSYPVEVTYDYEAVPGDLFDRTRMPEDIYGWQPLLPPLDPSLRIGVGSTPLVSVPGLHGLEGIEVLIKDESRNPTWSHKDRLNVCAVSSAVHIGAPGIVVASSGNHGASAAAMAARAGLPCIVVMSQGSSPRAVESFVSSYGAAVVSVPLDPPGSTTDSRWLLMEQLIGKLGFHPVSNLTKTHTGHAFGPEGYKTIAFELYLQLGRRVPGAVFVPTGYGELLFGVWKGFHELSLLGLIDDTPPIFACEVAGRGVLAKALRENTPAASVPYTPTDAYSMATSTGGYRSVYAMKNSSGQVIGVEDHEMSRAQDELARAGIWQELSGVSSLAGLRKAMAAGAEFDGPVVCIGTSSGFKDKLAQRHQATVVSTEWSQLSGQLADLGIPGTTVLT